MAHLELHKCGNCNRKISRGHSVEKFSPPVCNACYKKLGHTSWLDSVIKIREG